MNWDPLRLRYKYKTGDRVLVDGSPKYYARVVREVKNPHIGEAVKSPVAKGNRAISHARAVCRSIYHQWNKNSVRPVETHYEVEFEFDGHSGIVFVEDMVLVGDNHHLPASEFFHWWNDKINLMRREYGKIRALPFLVSFLPFISVWPYLLPPGVHRGNHNSTLVSIATGNFDAAGTWAVCDSTSELDSEAATVNVNTSNQDSTAFTPGAITVSAVALKYAGQTVTTGTVTVILRNSTAGSDVASVTVNANDFPSISAGTNGGWVVFKFASTHLLLAATNYVIRITSSAASTQARFYAASGTNLSRQLVTTTLQAPAANDKLIVAGDYTGAGTGNSYTATNNNTATTTFGPTASGAFGMTVSGKGSFVWGVAASTNYYLKLAGRLEIAKTGTWTKGATGSTIPTSSTMTLEMVPNANVDTGIEIRAEGVYNDYGPSISVLQAKLAADAAAAATSLTTNVSTGWLNGWSVALSSTTQTASQCEKKSLTANAVTTTLTIAAITNAHSGTNDANGDIRGELGLLTRYSIVKGTSTSLNTYMNVATTGVCNIQYCEHENFGSNTASKRGFDIPTSFTGTFNMQYCSLHDFTVTSALGINCGSSMTNFTYSNNVSYNINGGHYVNAGGSAANTISGNLFIFNTTSFIANIGDTGSTFTNNTFAGGGSVLFNSIPATCSGNVVHSGSGFDIRATAGTFASATAWRTSGGGLFCQGNAANITISDFVAFGNSTFGARVSSFTNVTFTSPVMHAGTVILQPVGIQVAGSALVYIENGTLGSPNTHASGDVSINSGVTSAYSAVYFHNTTFASTTEVTGNSNFTAGQTSGVFSQKHDATAGVHKWWVKYGAGSTDAVIYNGASGKSARFTPNNASNKGRIYVGSVRVPSGATCTPSIKVRCSIAADTGGALYNGNRPRFCVEKNVAAGISTDTVLATATSAANGVTSNIYDGETLSAATSAVTDDCVLRFFVDCDGTAGWINVDTFSASRSSSPSTIGEMLYWQDGQPAQQWENISGGSSGGFLTQGMLAGMRG